MCSRHRGQLHKCCHNNAALLSWERQSKAPAPLLLLAQQGAALGKIIVQLGRMEKVIIYMIMSNNNVCAFVPINAATPSEFVTSCTIVVTTLSHTKAFSCQHMLTFLGFFFC